MGKNRPFCNLKRNLPLQADGAKGFGLGSVQTLVSKRYIFYIDIQSLPDDLQSMEFEFDPGKSAANEAKHGINFEDAQALWDGDVIEAPAHSTTEPRTLIVGMINQKSWSAIVTRRGKKIRIISVRRSRENEIRAYENR